MDAFYVVSGAISLFVIFGFIIWMGQEELEAQKAINKKLRCSNDDLYRRLENKNIDIQKYQYLVKDYEKRLTQSQHDIELAQIDNEEKTQELRTAIERVLLLVNDKQPILVDYKPNPELLEEVTTEETVEEVKND